MTDNTVKKTTKKAADAGRAIHRIDLTLPVVQTDSYDIFCAVPLPRTATVTNLRSKPLLDQKKKPSHSTARLRSPARLRHLTGPIYVNVFLDVPPTGQDSTSTLAETIAPGNSSLRKSQTKRQHRPTKDDGERSQASSTDRLLYESFGSFDDQQVPKTNSTHWQNVHHPQLSSMKVLHSRRMFKHPLASPPDLPLKRPDHGSFDHLSQESMTSTNERLYDRVEQLTRHYFPVIQQLRHTRPHPDVATPNRMYLHREETTAFVPNLSRTCLQASLSSFK